MATLRRVEPEPLRQERRFESRPNKSNNQAMGREHPMAEALLAAGIDPVQLRQTWPMSKPTCLPETRIGARG